MFANYLIGKELISKINKELLLINKIKTNDTV